MLEARQLAGGSRRESWQRTGRAQPGHRASDAGVLRRRGPQTPPSPTIHPRPLPATFRGSVFSSATAPSFSPGTLDNVHRRT